MTQPTTQRGELVSFTYQPKNGSAVFVELVESGDGSCSVRWNDLLANEWVEVLPTVAQGFALVAALIHCGENAWGVGFSFGSVGVFGDEAQAFFQAVTQ